VAVGIEVGEGGDVAEFDVGGAGFGVEGFDV